MNDNSLVFQFHWEPVRNEIVKSSETHSCPKAKECMKIKELKAPESDFPAWGDLDKRAALWEMSTALSLLYAGADLFIMYHPEAVKAVRPAIDRLMG